MTTDKQTEPALQPPERVKLWICCHCQTPRTVGLTVCDKCHKRLHDTIEYARVRDGVTSAEAWLAQRGFADSRTYSSVEIAQLLTEYVAATAPIAAPQDEEKLLKRARQIIDAVTQSPCIVETRFFSQPDEVDRLEAQIVAMLQK